MGGWFGKPKKSDRVNEPNRGGISEKDRAVLELKRQRDRLQKYRLKLNDVIGRETEVAISLHRTGNTKRAILALRKKKYQQNLLEQTEGQLLNIEEMVNSIEFAAVQQQVFDALKTGTTVLQAINDEANIDDVEKLMEESAEAIAYQQRVDELISGKLDAEDEDEIAKEYAALTEDKLEFPSVPAKSLPDKIVPLTSISPKAKNTAKTDKVLLAS